MVLSLQDRFASSDLNDNDDDPRPRDSDPDNWLVIPTIFFSFDTVLVAMIFTVLCFGAKKPRKTLSNR